ncbi:hypothetical protein F383_19427 [Gossypium arboreum]|uniref:Uncharacterized protein n=1 Tax=Gossypium arboreum TaxID=29729 RepID=A0A0B0NUD0_GOSAR|nr:hypothetical protein F383_19427 [Gossypium arboreum]
MLTLELSTDLLTQADDHDEAIWCCSHKLTSSTEISHLSNRCRTCP